MLTLLCFLSFTNVASDFIKRHIHHANSQKTHYAMQWKDYLLQRRLQLWYMFICEVILWNFGNGEIFYERQGKVSDGFNKIRFDNFTINWAMPAMIACSTKVSLVYSAARKSVCKWVISKHKLYVIRCAFNPKFVMSCDVPFNSKWCHLTWINNNFG